MNSNVSNKNKEFFTLRKNSELFCLWIVHHLSLLYGYNNDGVYLGARCSRVIIFLFLHLYKLNNNNYFFLKIKANYEQLERILKTYISKGGKDGERDEIDEELCIMIPLLNTIVINWWQPRVSIISLLWDCFHKRLDEPFLLQTSGPWTLSVEKYVNTLYVCIFFITNLKKVLS